MDHDSSPDDNPRPRLVTPPPSFATEGDLLDGRYRLDALIGRGGTAEVYRSTDVLLGRAVAVKVFDIRLTDLNSVERQRSEMRSLAALDDPHLVAVHDARLVDAPDGPAGRFAPDHSYLVMELVAGGTLAERLHDGPLSPDEAAPIGIAVAAGLAAAHEQGLVHRDVKPANVLLADSGAVKLGDFGLARMLTAETRFTSAAALIGTAAYFSPEQARNEHAGAPADVYALGLVLLEALTGRREFPGSPVSSAVARLLRDPQIPDGLPAPWTTLLTRMTDKDPDARPTAVDVIRILTDADDDDAVVAAVGTTPRPVPVPLLLSGQHPAGEHLAGDRPVEPETAAWSSPLSPFLQRETADAGRRRRRSGLLVGAAALIGAVGLTLAIGSSNESPTAAQPTADAPGSSRAVRSAAQSTSRPAPTTAATTRAVTSSLRPTAVPSSRPATAERSVAPVTTSVPVRATTRAVAAPQLITPQLTAPSTTAAPAASAQAARQRAAAAKTAQRAAAQKAAAQRAAEEKAAAQRAAEGKAAAQRAAVEKAAAQRAADGKAAAKKQAAAVKAAEKERAAAEKAAADAEKKKDAAQPRAKDAPGGSGKKP